MRVFTFLVTMLFLIFSNISVSNATVLHDSQFTYEPIFDIYQEYQEDFELLVVEEIEFEPFYTGQELYYQLVDKLESSKGDISLIVIDIDCLPEEIWVELAETIKCEGHISMEIVISLEESGEAYGFMLAD